MDVQNYGQTPISNLKIWFGEPDSSKTRLTRNMSVKVVQSNGRVDEQPVPYTDPQEGVTLPELFAGDSVQLSVQATLDQDAHRRLCAGEQLKLHAFANADALYTAQREVSLLPARGTC